MDTEVTIVTFRDIFQYEAGKKSSHSEEYRQLSAQIILDKQDMEKLGVKDGQNVQLEIEVSSIIVIVKLSDDEPHGGLAFMTNSPWSNHLVRDDICETGIPEFKNIRVRVSPSREPVTQISELFQRMLA
jgi:formylmethanofuran dehydrogenase subunit D